MQTLELFNCDVATKDGYRESIFELLDQVLYVDGMDRDGQAAPDEYDGEGSQFFLTVVFPSLLNFECSGFIHAV